MGALWHGKGGAASALACASPILTVVFGLLRTVVFELLRPSWTGCREPATVLFLFRLPPAVSNLLVVRNFVSGICTT